jgi:Protein kinase domain
MQNRNFLAELSTGQMSTFEERLRTALSPSYEIERELTGAGMSRVFVATDVGLGRKIVIKVLPPELTAGVNRERFRREIQVAAQLQHPHIVTLLAAGENEELLYYTMPFIEGESLRVALEKGPLSVKDVVRILHDVVDALAYAHARGVIHRDIKPGNILKLGSHALVTDFGVAKALNAAMPATGITTSGMAIGTPAYMAPEQLAGDPAADHRIDIYAVGLLAYELLTGESPFTGPSPQATLAAQLTRDPEPLYKCCPDVAPPLSAIIMQCLAKEPNLRPPTAEALMTALDSITSSSGEIKTAATQVLPAVAKRRRRLTIGVGAATVALGSAVALFASQRGDDRQTIGVGAEATAKASVGPTPATPKAPAAPVIAAAPAAPPVPVSLTRADSLAIAEAVRKRLAQEEAAKGTKHVAMVADSITAYVRKVAIDSIVKAAFPKGVPVPVMPKWGEMGPNVATMWSGKRRIVITDPRASRSNELNAFGATLADSLRRAFAKRSGYTVVDADSVRSALAVSRARTHVDATLKPDIIITPTFVGSGDSMTVILTLRDLRGGPGGVRTASAKFAVANADAELPGIVRSVVSQMESLVRAPALMRVGKPPQAPRGSNER